MPERGDGTQYLEEFVDPRTAEGMKYYLQQFMQITANRLRNANVYNPEDPRSTPPTYEVNREGEDDRD